MTEHLREGAVHVVAINAVDQSPRTKNYIGVPHKEVVEAGARQQLVAEKFDDTALGQFILVARAFIAEAERENAAQRTKRGSAERRLQDRIA